MNWKNYNYTSIALDSNIELISWYSDIDDIVRLANGNQDYVVLGEGSNVVLWGDKLCLLKSNANMKVEYLKDKLIVHVTAGVLLSQLIDVLSRTDSYEIIYLSGIPGTVGGAIFQNSGAFNFCISQFIDKVICWDSEQQKIIEFCKSDCEFSYRSSVFMKNANRYLIISATFISSNKLTHNMICINDKYISLNLAIKKIKDMRVRKFPDPIKYPNSGSLFLPYFTKDNNCVNYLKGKGVAVINSEFGFKVPAGALIEKMGLKGAVICNKFCVSSKHANFLCNISEHSNSQDWFFAVKWLHDKIHEEYGVSLVTEVNVIGYNIPTEVGEICRIKEAIKL
ncbi:MAG: FAD-binding protein [Bacillota bacterium]